jgi:hypothetical protein
MTYYKIQNGKLISSLELTPEEASIQTNLVTEEPPEVLPDHELHWNGAWFQKPVQFYVPSYREQRAIMYPPLEDQLDALWHAMDIGSMEKHEPFYSMIKSVKERFPK